MEKQMIELQEMLAHQQFALDKMSEELFAQQKEVAELKRQLKRLGEQVDQAQPDDGGAGQGGYEPPPPHY